MVKNLGVENLKNGYQFPKNIQENELFLTYFM